MRQSLTAYDLPILRGWSYGICTSFMWKKDKHGVDWQLMVDDGEFLKFAQKIPEGTMSSFASMTHEKYKELFT